MDINKEPYVDIILPNYNKGEYINESINSVISQTYSNWNLLVIDDHSNDNSSEIIKKYNNKKIKIIFLSKNKGVAFCRNLGMRLTRAKYISFIDADDYWTSNKLSEQISFMEKHSHSFTYTSYVPFIGKKDRKIFKKRIIVPDSFNYNQFTSNTSIAMSSTIMKRSIIGPTRFINLKICEDYHFKCKILKKNITAFGLNIGTMFSIV